MPIRSNEQPHHLPQGPSRQLDIEFRHSRYESTEPIIDLCYHAMQQLFRSMHEDQFIDYQYGLETPRRNRYSLFRNVAFEELSFHHTKGTMSGSVTTAQMLCRATRSIGPDCSRMACCVP